MKHLILFLLACPWLAGGLARAEASAAAGKSFDPARHMLVSEVRPGMKGYGLTVFKGTKIEKFDVVVLSVLKNFTPRHDVVMIQCQGDLLQHTGSVAGMSGSPIFLKDDSGRYRMIGAFAYGWPLAKDPVAGVQPIQYMLDLPVEKNAALAARNATSQPAAAGSSSSAEPAERTSWSLTDAGMLSFVTPRHIETEVESSSRLNQRDGRSPRLQALATPLMASGLSPDLLRRMGPMLGRMGLTALEAGSAGAVPAGTPQTHLEPGGVLAVPLLTGDVDLTAIGTVTEVMGNRVYGFGHPFNNEGAISLPMGGGYISGIVANLSTSFKLGALTNLGGTLNTDASVGVAGESGAVPAMVPLEFTVTPPDGADAQHYHFAAVLHPRFTPIVSAMALGAAMAGDSELPQFNTVDYSLHIDFANGQSLHIANTAVNISTTDLFNELVLPMQAASENPFERVLVRKVTGDIHISNEAREAQILEVNVPKSHYHPGDTVKGFITYKPFRAMQGTLPVEFELPRDLPQGTYQLIISDAQRYFQDEQQAEPFRFTAEKVEDVFSVLSDVARIRQNAVYLRLLRQADGVALGRIAMPRLPSSIRQVLLGAGRSTTTSFVSSTVRVIPTHMVMEGSAEFAITIDPSSKVASAGARPGRSVEPGSHNDDQRAKPGAGNGDSAAPGKGQDDSPASPAGN